MSINGARRVGSCSQDEALRDGREPDEPARPVRSFDVQVEARHAYTVTYEPGLLDRYGEVFVEALGPRPVAVLTDERVERLHGDRLFASLDAAGLRHRVFSIPDGERSKNLETFASLIDRMARAGVDRRSVVLNFGGGVISDLGGYVAASYMRGIDYVNLATSLIGQVDASVGGKVAVNADLAKNFIGAFHHPRHVAGDPALIRTLSDRDFRSGMAEIIKVAIISSPALFARLETERAAILRRDPVVLTEVIEEAARLKMDLIALDPYERDLRRPLNFGHTIGHPIETEFSYANIRHGEAVAIGMGVATTIATRRGIVPSEDAARIFGLLRAYGLASFPETIRPDRVVEHVRYVRLIRANRLHYVLPTRVGAVLITDDVEDAELVRGFEEYDDIETG